MATATAEQRHASAGLAQDLSSLQPPDILRTMAADGRLDDISDSTAVTGSQRARMAEELVQRVLTESSPTKIAPLPSKITYIKMDPLDRIRNGFANGPPAHSHFRVACGSRHESSMIPIHQSSTRSVATTE